MAVAKYIAVARLTDRDPKTKVRISVAPGDPYVPHDTAERDRLLAGGYIRKAKDAAANSDEAKAAEEEARKNAQ